MAEPSFCIVQLASLSSQRLRKAAKAENKDLTKPTSQLMASSSCQKPAADKPQKPPKPKSRRSIQQLSAKRLATQSALERYKQHLKPMALLNPATLRGQGRSQYARDVTFRHDPRNPGASLFLCCPPTAKTLGSKTNLAANFLRRVVTADFCCSQGRGGGGGGGGGESGAELSTGSQIK